MRIGYGRIGGGELEVGPRAFRPQRGDAAAPAIGEWLLGTERGRASRSRSGAAAMGIIVKVGQFRAPGPSPLLMNPDEADRHVSWRSRS